MDAVLIMGTFNPATQAHICLGQLVNQAMPQADVWYVPAMDSFLYSWKCFGKAGVMPGATRIRLLREAIAEAGFPAQVSEIEVKGLVDGKTVRTAAYFRDNLGYERTFICFGTDKIAELERWENGEQLLRENHILVVTRGGDRLADVMTDFTRRFQSHFVELKNKAVYEGISSTNVREAYMDGKIEEVRDFLPACVYRYLTENGRVYLSNPEEGFDAKKVREGIVAWIRRWFELNGPTCNAVVSLSGGKDSSVVAALCCEAIGPDRVIGVMMPNGEKASMGHAKKLAELLKIETVDIDIAPIFRSAVSGIENTGIGLSEQADFNLIPRIRMSVLYAVSQSRNGRVSENCTLSEKRIGGRTRFGDAAGDFSPLGNLTSTEVWLIGQVLGLPEEIIGSGPEELLVTLNGEEHIISCLILDRFIRTGVLEDQDIRKQVKKIEKENLFKLQPVATFMPDYD